MKLSAIVAMSENEVIGVEGRLPWHLSEDLKRFKRLTMGSPIIMGRKTFESIGKPLPGRENLVLSRADVEWEGVQVFNSMDALLHHLKVQPDQSQAFVIGGSEIYQAFMPYVQKIYLTVVHQKISGDATFPWSKVSKSFQETARSERFRDETSGLEYSFIDFERCIDSPSAL